MIEAILGMLVGSGLFFGGFHFHDVNYRPGGEWYHDSELNGWVSGSITDGNTGKRYVVNLPHYNNPDRKKELIGYAMGTAGAAILALSVKHAWDKREKKQADGTDQALERFRRRIGKKEGVIGMLLGLGLSIAGVEFHDGDYKRDGRQIVDSWPERFANPPSNIPEHMGYLMGATGGAVLALSVKHVWWGSRSKKDPISTNLNRAYQRFRISLGQDKVVRDAWMCAAAFRLCPPSAKIAPFPSRLVIDNRYSDQTIHNVTELLRDHPMWPSQESQK